MINFNEISSIGKWGTTIELIEYDGYVSLALEGGGDSFVILASEIEPLRAYLNAFVEANPNPEEPNL